ncbi:MAG TPA: malectin domain-containing carbohydrate-binding protein [Bryobacteraceae bacterium]|nr:malectin domain-containing carbohydrate-binding protein [Bryobacteraceae bacterium]
MSRLLQYLCNKYLEGATEEVKEYQIGVEVLGRPPSFDPAEDAAARVEAHRLRKRLKEYYETEGREHTLRIELPLGHYAVVFQPLVAEPPVDDKAEAREEAHSQPPALPPNGAAALASENPPASPGFNYRIAGFIALGVILLAATVAALGWRRSPTVSPAVSKAPSAAIAPAQNVSKSSAPAGAQGAIRISCGRTKTHTDRGGDVWDADRDYEGGTPFEVHRQYIARAYDPRLFQTGRTGNFTYKIPLGPGTYELHLYFNEGTYGPALPAGGGEISRIFEVRANGKPILQRFDIYADAGGSNIADVRVFKDITAGPGQVLTLSFQGQTGAALLNAIELVPAAPHRLNPIRITAQDGFYTDSAGMVWKPDRYYNGGQNATHAVELSGTRDPDLFSRERYGRFDYAIPVDKGTYRLSLYFAEEYFGPGGSRGGQPGTRVFDVTCNGVALLREFDLLKEAGMAQAVVKTFHGLTPNGQGTLLVSFSPIHDYASLYALEVVDETN